MGFSSSVSIDVESSSTNPQRHPILGAIKNIILPMVNPTTTTSIITTTTTTTTTSTTTTTTKAVDINTNQIPVQNKVGPGEESSTTSLISVSITSSTATITSTSTPTDSLISPISNDIPTDIPTVETFSTTNTPHNFITSTPAILIFASIGLTLVVVIVLFLHKRYSTPKLNSNLKVLSSLSSPKDFWLGTDAETGKLKINRNPSILFSADSSDWGKVFEEAKADLKYW